MHGLHTCHCKSQQRIYRQTKCCLTIGIDSDWRHAKVTMPRYGVHRGMHAGYLAEFMWRRKHMDSDRFIALIQDINIGFQKKYVDTLPKSLK